MLKLNKNQKYKLYRYFLDDDKGIEANYLGKTEIYRGNTPSLATKDETSLSRYHIFVDKDNLFYLVEWQIQYDQPYLQIVKSGRNLTFLLYNFKQSFVSLEGQPKPNDYLDCSYSKDKESE